MFMIVLRICLLLPAVWVVGNPQGFAARGIKPLAPEIPSFLAFVHSNFGSQFQIAKSCSNRFAKNLQNHPASFSISSVRPELSVDWVSPRSKYSPNTQRPGFLLPSSWREGKEYFFSSNNRFVRGESVGVLCSDGSVKFGRIEQSPKKSEEGYVVQVETQLGKVESLTLETAVLAKLHPSTGPLMHPSPNFSRPAPSEANLPRASTITLRRRRRAAVSRPNPAPLQHKSWPNVKPRGGHIDDTVNSFQNRGGGYSGGGRGRLGDRMPPLELGEYLASVYGPRCALLTKAVLSRDAEIGLLHLLDSLEPYVNGTFGSLAPFDAVAAMNRVKRLIGGGDGATRARADGTIWRLAETVRPHLASLSSKYLAIAANSISGVACSGGSAGAGARDFVREVGRRCLDVKDPREYSPQAISMIINAMAKAGVSDREVLEHLSSILQRLDCSPADYNPQSISIVVNGYSKLGVADEKLFLHLADVALSMPSGFTSQALGSIFNAYAKLGLWHEDLMSHLSQLARNMPPSAFDAQAVSNIVNALARLGHADPPLLSHLAAATAALPVATPQAVATIANAYAQLQSLDLPLWRLLSRLAQSCPPYRFGPQDISELLNAQARCMARDPALVAHLARAVDASPSFRAPGADSFTPQGAANVLHALAVLDAGADSAGHRLAAAAAAVLAAVPVKELAPRDVSHTAWAVAAMQLNDRALLAKIWEGIGAHLQNMCYTDLSQVHQFLLTCRLDGATGRSGLLWGGAESGAPLAMRIKRALLEKALFAFLGVPYTEPSERGPGAITAILDRLTHRLSAFVAAEVKTSQLQRDVADSLRDMGNADLVEEYRDPLSGYSIDIWLPHGQVAVEVDGPWHFHAEEQTPLGPTLMKRRHLAQLGYKVVSVPYWEWMADTRAAQRRALLYSLLAGPAPLPRDTETG